ncbi:MAG: peptide-methionine (S)-S-oxide reductase MsrA [Proteobacteria bacterium]|nr:peptide-methionine (S)-S-oxide reductase MsrA [Pseudomonadota bacterium]
MTPRTLYITLAALVIGCVPASDAKEPPKGAPASKGGPREVAVLAAGCFWGVEAWMAKAPGIVDIEVGYAGGEAKTTSYEQVSSGATGFAEAVRITFDPSVVSYEQLLAQWFFRIHDPTTKNRQGNDEGPQYRSAIFPQTDAQRASAQKVVAKADESHLWSAPITTTIEPSRSWVKAEDYHQDYLVKHPGGYDNHYLRELTLRL